MIISTQQPNLTCSMCREVKQGFRLVDGKRVCYKCCSTFHGRSFIEPVRKVPMKCG